jgi:hypothetical protein
MRKKVNRHTYIESRVPLLFGIKLQCADRGYTRIAKQGISTFREVAFHQELLHFSLSIFLPHHQFLPPRKFPSTNLDPAPPYLHHQPTKTSARMQPPLLRLSPSLHHRLLQPASRPLHRHNLPPRLKSQISPFSTQKPTPPPNPSFGSASFKDLGANRTVKIVVISFLSIMATVESIAWTKFLWGKFGPKPEPEGED